MEPTTLSILSAMAAAAWSVWTWRSERQKEREHGRNQMSAQFITSLIASTQELQRILYRILEEDELAYYKREFPKSEPPASRPAIDLLYHMAFFFGWSLMTLRFGPYTRDARMISIMSRISDVLESRTAYPGEAFRFTLGERLGLAQIILIKVGDNVGIPAFITMPRYKFEEDVRNPKSEHAGLYRSNVVSESFKALDNADRPETLEGRERLKAFQNLLVDLANYLEKEEGFSVHLGQRSRAGKRDDELLDSGSESVFVLHKMPGRVRLGVPRLHQDRSLAAKLQSHLESLNLVKSVRVNPDAACVIVNHSSNISQQVFIGAALQAIEELLNQERQSSSLRS